MINKYIKVMHISERKTRDIIRLFCINIKAKKTAELVRVSSPNINKFYNTFRERIADPCEAESPFTNGEIKFDESYFGTRRVRRLTGRGTKGKTAVSGMLKRGKKFVLKLPKVVL